MSIDENQLRLCAQTCAALMLRSAGRAVTRAYGGALAGVSLEVTQFTLLVAAGLSPGVTVSRLAEVLVMDRSALARNLGILERHGLVRLATGKDKRTRCVSLTDQGQVVLADALPLWQRAQDRTQAVFGAERLANLLSELRAFLTAMEDF